MAPMIEQFIQTWGYAAVFAGTFLEGETVLVAAGFAAHRGMLDLSAVIATAAFGSFLGDQFFYFLGRRHGNRVARRFPAFRRRAARARVLLRRYHLPFILSVRFLYGLRIAGPIAIGMARVPWPRFLALNALGALLWAMLIGGAGYFFGAALEIALADLRNHESWILVAILIVGVCAALAVKICRKPSLPRRD